MPRTRHTVNTFTSGVLDPLLHERSDYAGYSAGVAQLDNFLIHPQGAVSKRPGTLYVANAKDATATRLIPFIVSNTVAAVLEVGNLYLRVYENNAYAGVEVVTPYTTAQLADLQFAQNGSVMYLVHPSHQPRTLTRTSATVWSLQVLTFSAPAVEEAGQTGTVGLTLSAVSGTITVTAASGFFLDADVGRGLRQSPTIGAGYGVVTAVASATSATVSVTTTFGSVNLVATEWFLTASPVAILTVTGSQPIGTQITAATRRINPTAGNLVTNGTFTGSLAGWTNNSGGSITTGTADAGSSDVLLNDAASTFITAGVRTGMRALNTTDTTEDKVTNVLSQTQLATTADGSTWAAGKAFDIQRTGTAVYFAGDLARLNGGEQGIAWLYQIITTVANVTYRLTFDVSSSPLSAYVSDNSIYPNLTQELSYTPGREREIIFTAVGVTTVLNFRNNQNLDAFLDNVVCRIYEVNAFRSTDVGKFIRTNDGIVELTGFVHGRQMTGIVRRELTSTTDAIAGGWSIEESQWDATKGWPQTVTFNGGRLVFGASSRFIARLWGSAISIFDEFALGTAAADPYQYDISATRTDIIEWLVGERALLVGTASREYTVRGSLDHIITPTSVDVASPTGFGSYGFQPILAPRAFFFLQKSRRRLYENVGVDDFGSDDREVGDRTLPIETLITSNVSSVAFQQNPQPVLWITLADGRLLSLSYLFEHRVAGWALHPTTGTFHAVAVIPHPDGTRDQVWFITERISGTRYIERLDDQGHYYGELQSDCAVDTTVLAPITIVTGLTHLNGLQVAVMGDGAAQASKTVAAGQITADLAATRFEIGIPITATLETLRPTLDNVPLSNLQIASVRPAISFYQTINAVVNGERLVFALPEDLLGAAPALFTGLRDLELVGWNTSGTITVTQDQPYPMTIRGIFRTLEVESP